MTATLDQSLFFALNGLSGRSVSYDALVIFLATYLIFVMAALEIGYVAVAWKTSHFEGRFENFTHAGVSAILGFLMETIIGFLWFRPRPFVALSGVVKLVDRLPTDKSFPSGHATIAFALAFGIRSHNKRWGNALLVLATLVGLARIAAGVHYPADVLAGALVGYVASKCAAPVKEAIEPYLDLFSVFRNNKRKQA